MTLPPITLHGSVKNIRVLKDPTEQRMGEAYFEFTDETSIKDRGKLGFTTPNKGSSMCTTAVYNFQQLEKLGIPTIFREQVLPNVILVDYVRVLDPDTIDLREIRTNRLFPIEVISRDVITQTSSARKRLADGTLNYGALGLSDMPTEFPVILPKTYVDGSTKLRVTGDEYLPWDQLKKLACATTHDINTVDAYIRQTTTFGQQRGAAIGFLIFDHKDEYAHNERGELILADVPMSLDEITGALVGPFKDLDDFRNKEFTIFQAGKNHNTTSHVNASKQLYRDHYDADHPEWVLAVKQGLQQRVPKNQLPTTPTPPEELVTIVSNIYQAFANEWTNNKNFNVPSLAECVQHYQRWATNHYTLR